MRILLATDAFPPDCGGSGWSTHALARGLRARGHAVRIVVPTPGRGADIVRDYDGFSVVQALFPRLPVPVARTYATNEWLWPRLAESLRRLALDLRADLLHAQHIRTCPAAVDAGRRLGIPVACTVRDAWPVCYWSTTIVDHASPSLCPACSAGMMTRCIRHRAGAAWPVSLCAIPYMRSNLARKQRALAAADAIVAVSHAVARDLQARSALLARSRVEVIPTPVDVDGIRAHVAGLPRPIPGPYVAFVGTLDVEKGSAFLLPAVRHARLPWPLVIVGDGPARERLEREASAAGRPVVFTGRLPRDQALVWLAHASVLVFPSYAPEALSAVLLEAAALGVPIAAMNTGGTADIIQDGVTGLLAGTTEELGDAVARLASDAALGLRLGAGAQAHAERAFASPGVATAFEALYADLVYGRKRYG